MQEKDIAQKDTLIKNTICDFKKSMFWICLYAFIHLIFKLLSISYISWISIGIRVLYWLILLFYLYKKNLLIKYYICFSSRFIIVLFLMLITFIYGCFFYSINVVLNIVISVICEEMAFRVAFPKLLTSQGHKSLKVSIISSVMFALFHIINIFDSSAHGDFTQIIYAFCAGLLFCFLTQHTESIFPAMCLHFFMNVISWNMVLSYKTNLFVIIVSIIFLIYPVIILKKENKRGIYL